MTEQEITAAWNAEADSHNQWDSLSLDEKVEYAAALGAAAERARIGAFILSFQDQARCKLENGSDPDGEMDWSAKVYTCDLFLFQLAYQATGKE